MQRWRLNSWTEFWGEDLKWKLEGKFRGENLRKSCEVKIWGDFKKIEFWKLKTEFWKLEIDAKRGCDSTCCAKKVEKWLLWQNKVKLKLQVWKWFLEVLLSLKFQ